MEGSMTHDACYTTMSLLMQRRAYLSAATTTLRDGLIAELDVFYKDPGALATVLAASYFAFKRTLLIVAPNC